MDHTLLGIAGGRYEAESDYGKLPFDLFLLVSISLRTADLNIEC